MRYLKNKSFKKGMKNQGLDDDYLRNVLDDIHDGRAIPLGSKLFKTRAARKGHGKSGGFRNFFFWKKDELIVFCLLFGKNEQGNLNHDEKQVLKILSNEYDKLTENEIEQNIKNKQFGVIKYD
ncbi:MAG: type II toxin-antitoxin system RelE/ParE family toxin [Candidatus Scalindua sp.]